MRVTSFYKNWTIVKQVFSFLIYYFIYNVPLCGFWDAVPMVAPLSSQASHNMKDPYKKIANSLYFNGELEEIRRQVIKRPQHYFYNCFWTSGSGASRSWGKRGGGGGGVGKFCFACPASFSSSSDFFFFIQNKGRGGPAPPPPPTPGPFPWVIFVTKKGNGYTWTRIEPYNWRLNLDNNACES